MNIRVVLIDDHELLRAGVRQFMARVEGMECVGEADDLESGLEVVRQTQADVVVVDLSLPDGHGFDLITSIREESPESKILVLSAHQGREWVDRAIELGADGYVDKTAGLEELLTSVQSVFKGRRVISVSEPSVDDANQPPTPTTVKKTEPTELSQREEEVLTRIARGLTNQEAANELFLSVKTVETYRARLTKKLGMRGRAELFDYAQQHGLLSKSGSSS